MSDMPSALPEALLLPITDLTHMFNAPGCRPTLPRTAGNSRRLGRRVPVESSATQEYKHPATRFARTGNHSGGGGAGSAGSSSLRRIQDSATTNLDARDSAARMEGNGASPRGSRDLYFIVLAVWQRDGTSNSVSPS